jgi:hypothetical protein
MHDINQRDELSDLDLEQVASGKDGIVSPGGLNSETRSFSFSWGPFSWRRTRGTISPNPGFVPGYGYGPGIGYRGWW